MEANKPLLLSLIRDDLVNYKLVSQLQVLGLDALDYYLNLSTTVFHLMGYADSHESDRVYEDYLKMAKRVQRIDLGASPNELDALAGEIYAMLEAQAPATKAVFSLTNMHKPPRRRPKSSAAAA